MTHEPVALLSDRNVDTVVSWLKRHPFVKLVSRDGFRPFREAVSQASATIVQVFDRWHLLRGAKRQLELYLTSALPSAVSVPNSSTDQAEPLSGSIPETKYQRQRWERYEKKWALIKQIQEEHQKGKNISVLAREFQLDR
jgi:transposase